MKVVFLDIDGVLITKNSSEFYCDEYQCLSFDVRCVAALNELFQKTDAKIVLSSGWRFHFDSATIADIFKHFGIQSEIIGHTPFVMGGRLAEIKKWLSQHPEVQAHAIIDDDLLDGNWVQTESENGFTKDHINKTLAFLESSK